MTVTGGFRSVLTAAQREQASFDFRFVLPTGSAVCELLREAGFPVDELPFVEIGRSVRRLTTYGPMLAANGWRLAQLIRRHRIDVLHSNDLYNLTPYVAQTLLGRRAPKLVAHVRLLGGAFPAALYAFWCQCARRYADRIVCVSEAVRQGAFAADAKATVIYEPLDATPERHPPKTDFGPATGLGRVRVLYLSNYIPGKGHDTALRAFALAHARNTGLRLDLYGGTMNLEKNRLYRDQLKQQVDAQGLAEAVHFHDFVTDVEGVMKSYDIALNCSEAESFSLVCFDALRFGVPLVATDCGGPRELFEDGRSGYLVPVNDAEAAADRLLRLAADPLQRQAFSAASRAYVRQKFGQHDRTAEIWRF